MKSPKRKALRTANRPAKKPSINSNIYAGEEAKLLAKFSEVIVNIFKREIDLQ